MAEAMGRNAAAAALREQAESEPMDRSQPEGRTIMGMNKPAGQTMWNSWTRACRPSRVVIRTHMRE
jgi:hypothetical protein